MVISQYDEGFALSIALQLANRLKESNYIVYIKNSHDEFSYLNKGAEELLGVGLDSIRFKKFEKGSKEENLYRQLFANDLDIIDVGQPISKVYTLGGDDPIKSNTCFTFTKCPVYKNGEGYIVGFGVEITDWLVQENTLNFYKKILDSLTDSFVLTDPEYPFLIRYVNQAFVDMTGYSREEVLGKSPTEILGKNLEEESDRREFNKKLRRHETCDQTFTNYRKDGTSYKAHIKVIPLYFEPDDVIPRYLIGIQRDITEKVLSNMEKIDKQNKLEALYHGTQNFVWLLDTRGYIDEASKIAKFEGRITDDFKSGELLFWEGRWWKVNSETESQVKNLIDAVKNTGKKQTLKIPLLNCDNNVSTVKLGASPYRDNSGFISYIVVDGIDVTDEEYQKRSLFNLGQSDEYYEYEQANQLVDQDIKERVIDPDTGLIVRVNSQEETLERLKQEVEEVKNVYSTVINIGNIMSILNKPIVKWLIIALLGISSVDTARIFIEDIVIEHIIKP